MNILCERTLIPNRKEVPTYTVRYSECIGFGWSLVNTRAVGPMAWTRYAYGANPFLGGVKTVTFDLFLVRTTPKRHFQLLPLNCYRQYTSRQSCSIDRAFCQSVTVKLYGAANVGLVEHRGGHQAGHDGLSYSASRRHLRPMVTKPEWTICSSTPSVQQSPNASELVVKSEA